MCNPLETEANKEGLLQVTEMTTKDLMLNDPNWLVWLKHLWAVCTTNISMNQRFPARKQSLQKKCHQGDLSQGWFYTEVCMEKHSFWNSWLDNIHRYDLQQMFGLLLQ